MIAIQIFSGFTVPLGDENHKKAADSMSPLLQVLSVLQD
jgi:hypothetical protein